MYDWKMLLAALKSPKKIKEFPSKFQKKNLHQQVRISTSNYVRF